MDAMITRMPESVIDGWNKIITNLRYCADVYGQMYIDASGMALDGFACYFKRQEKEDRGHARKVVKFMGEALAPVRLESVPQPPTFTNVTSMLQGALRLENKITDQVNTLYWLAYAEKSAPTVKWLKWLILDQQEEEAELSELLEKLKIVGATGLGLMWMDREMKKT